MFDEGMRSTIRNFLASPEPRLFARIIVDLLRTVKDEESEYHVASTMASLDRAMVRLCLDPSSKEQGMVSCIRVLESVPAGIFLTPAVGVLLDAFFAGREALSGNSSAGTLAIQIKNDIARKYCEFIFRNIKNASTSKENELRLVVDFIGANTPIYATMEVYGRSERVSILSRSVISALLNLGPVHTRESLEFFVDFQKNFIGGFTGYDSWAIMREISRMSINQMQERSLLDPYESRSADTYFSRIFSDDYGLRELGSPYGNTEEVVFEVFDNPLAIIADNSWTPLSDAEVIGGPYFNGKTERFVSQSFFGRFFKGVIISNYMKNKNEYISRESLFNMATRLNAAFGVSLELSNIPYNDGNNIEFRLADTMIMDFSRNPHGDFSFFTDREYAENHMDDEIDGGEDRRININHRDDEE